MTGRERCYALSSQFLGLVSSAAATWRRAPLIRVGCFVGFIYFCVGKDRVKVFMEVNNKVMAELCFAGYRELQ